MSRLFERRVRVVVGAEDPAQSILIEDLRVQFKIKKTLKKEPSNSEIAIFNLSEATRAQIQKRYAKVIVEAGYTTTIAQIFNGDARTIDPTHDGPNGITKIKCGDGERNYRYSHVSESFRPGTTVADVVGKVAGAMGYDERKTAALVAQFSTEQFTQGFVAHGRAAYQLEHLLRSRGLEWSIQDGQIQILEAGKPVKNTAILLSVDTGLVGSPEHGTPEKKGKPALMKVKSLLQPQFKCGGPVHIRAEKIDALYRIETLTHTGDTAGNDWYSELECLPISG